MQNLFGTSQPPATNEQLESACREHRRWLPGNASGHNHRTLLRGAPLPFFYGLKNPYKWSKINRELGLFHPYKWSHELLLRIGFWAHCRGPSFLIINTKVGVPFLCQFRTTTPRKFGHLESKSWATAIWPNHLAHSHWHPFLVVLKFLIVRIAFGEVSIPITQMGLVNVPRFTIQFNHSCI